MWGSCWGVQAATTSSTLPLYLFICCALGDDMGITAQWVETQPFRTIFGPGGGGGVEIAGGRGTPAPRALFPTRICTQNKLQRNSRARQFPFCRPESFMNHIS